MKPAPLHHEGEHLAQPYLSTSCFILLALCVAARLLISTGVYAMFKISYVETGGSPLVKVHVGTYLAIIAVAVWLWQNGSPMARLLQHFRAHLGQLMYLAMMILCMVHMLRNVGMDGNLLTIPDTFICAGLVAMLLSYASPQQLRWLGCIFLAIVCVSGLIAAMENLFRWQLIVISENELTPTDEARGHGFFDSALAGAMVTQLAIILVLAMRLGFGWTLCIMAVLTMGLFGFAGRAAIVVTGVTLVVLGIGYLLRGLMQRTLQPKDVGVAVLLTMAIPLTIGFILTTPLGERIAHHFWTNDASAQSRSIALDIFDVIDMQTFLVGAPLAKIQMYIDSLRVIDIENPWIDWFLVLGLIGFSYMAIGLVAYFISLWRSAGLLGHLMIVTTLITASTSNSFGRKSNIIVMMTVALYVASVYERRQLPVEDTALRVRVRTRRPFRVAPLGETR